MVIRVENIAAEVVDESRHAGDNTFPVFTVNQDDDGFFAIRGHSREAPFVL
jgi:hypothetical protein